MIKLSSIINKSVASGSFRFLTTLLKSMHTIRASLNNHHKMSSNIADYINLAYSSTAPLRTWPKSISSPLLLVST